MRDPFTGKQKLYAPDPDQTIPAYKIAQSIDTFNQANSIASKQSLPIEISFIPAQSQIQAAPLASPLIQISNAVPQQQLPDTYALPISNQPQLQQHLLQQQSMLHSMTPIVYNPTYLVTQSNNLLKQHQEQLFRPAPAFLGSINQPSADMSTTQPLNDVNSVASPGQLLQSAQSQQKQVQQQPSTNLIAPALRGEYPAPTFQRYVAEKPPPPTSMSSIIFGQTSFGNEVQQPILTESELNNLMNYGSPSQNAETSSGFVASSYYQSHPDPQIEIENRQRQQLNDITISQANEEIKEKIKSVDTSLKPAHPARKKTSHEEHQKKVAEHFKDDNFKSKSPLRIVVPDEDYKSV